jgi:outer membrane protein assembly factor BamB
LAVGYDVKIGNEELTAFGRTVGATIPAPTEGPMDHVWPMKCHDVRHTGRSPYSAADNSGVEKWRFRTASNIEDGIVIDKNGTLYVGDTNLYAVYPNGTLKWIFEVESYCKSIPAIAEDGTVYIGDFHGKFYAVNPNGTQKWKFTPPGGGNSITSSPAIGGDGTVYFGLMGGYRVYALNPNGSVKWYYKTGYHICSSPAIGENGTIYIGSCDKHLYALNPNGTLRWRYKTGESHAPPSVGDDGTVYIESFDGYLYALSQNGTLKWKFKSNGAGAEAVAIAEDGTIYHCSEKLFALSPDDGSVVWSYDFEGGTAVCSPAIDSEGIVYVSKGRMFYAFNPDGSLRWEYSVPFPNSGMGGLSTSPCIGSDGTVYIGSGVHEFIEPGASELAGYIHAFGSGNEKKASMTRPREGCLYLFNKELGETPRGNTAVIGDLDVKTTVTQPEKVEEVLFRLKYRCGYVPGKEWVEYVDREPPFDFEWCLNASEPIFIPYTLNIWFDLEARAYYKGGFEYRDKRGGCMWSEELTIIYIHPF